MKIAFLMPLGNMDIQAILEDRAPSHFLFSLVKSYVARGNEIVFVTSSNRIRKTTVIRHEKLCEYIVKINKHGNLRAFLEFKGEIYEIERILKREKPDIIHAHWCYEHAMGALQYDKTKTVITLHDWPDVVCPAIGNYFWRRREILGNSVLRDAVHVTAVSGYIAELYKRQFPDRKISIIPNFIERNILLEEYVPVRHTKTIYAINNGFGNIKNTKAIMQTFNIVRKKIYDITLVMYGDGHEENGVANQWACQNGLEEGIVFKGNIERNKMLSALEEGGILLHTSVTEAFGMVLIEAMAKKVLVIGGEDSGAVPWVLGYGKYGILIDINNPDEIADRLEKVIVNRKAYDDIVENAYQYVKKEFLIDAVKERYQEEYGKMIV